MEGGREGGGREGGERDASGGELGGERKKLINVLSVESQQFDGGFIISRRGLRILLLIYCCRILETHKKTAMMNCHFWTENM